MRAHKLLVTVAAFAGLVVAGCGSSSPAGAPGGGSDGGGGGQTSGSSVDPCTLLTDAHAAAALTKPSVQHKTADGPVAGCTWTPPDNPNGPLDTSIVIVNILDTTVFDGAKRAGSQQGLVLEPASGVGDDAYYQTTGNLTILNVKKNGVCISVSVSNDAFNATQVKDAERTLALEAVSHL